MNDNNALFRTSLSGFAGRTTTHEDASTALDCLAMLRAKHGFTPRVAMLDEEQGALVISTITSRALHVPSLKCGIAASEDVRHLADDLLVACRAPIMNDRCPALLFRDYRSISFSALDTTPRLHRVVPIPRSQLLLNS